MKCPKCHPVNLAPTKLEAELPAMGCRSCDGVLVSLLHYRDWAERTVQSFEAETLVSEAIEKKDTKSVLTCPKCTRIMTKYQITGNQKNRLDLCGSCDEAWIDSGEWGLLKSLELAKDLPSVFTDAWQTRITKETTEKQQYARLTKLVGESDAERTQEIRQWLKGNKNKFMILHYLGYE